MYVHVHGLLVRFIPAYRRLVQSISRAARDAVDGPVAVAAVPCSTGEWLRPIADLGAPWTLVDISEPVMERAARGLEPAKRLVVDLADRLPIDAPPQGLIVCVHALHVLPDPAFQLRRLAALLQPGGSLLLVTFDRDEGIRAFVGRVRRGHGLATAVGMLPWKVLDRLWTGTTCYLSAAELRDALDAAGLVVHRSEAVFAGVSTLTVAGRPVAT